MYTGALGRPRRLAGVPIPTRHPPALPAADVEDVQVPAHATQHARTVGAVVEPVRDDRRPGPPGPGLVVLAVAGLQVDRRRKRDA
jgi:hypothetical protein